MIGAGGPDDFLSGTSGGVLGLRLTARALARDALLDTLDLLRLRRLRLARAARRSPARRVLVLATEHVDRPNLLAAVRAELARSRHEVTLAVAEVGDRGKFENLNALLAAHPAAGHDWLLVLDDDVTLPRGFLDAFLFLAERFSLTLAQPAHRWRSHAAWEVTRRRARPVVRETAFVEVGPVTAFAAASFDVLLPFPPLRAGWGLDNHWSALAREQGWRLGVVDAAPVRHGLRTIGAAYDRAAAMREAREFLRDRPYTPAREAQRTLARHTSWR